jgi:opine dehydrogenase
MLLNYAAVERANGELSLMNEGMTVGVLRCIDALDGEKMALCAALRLTPASIDELYIELGSSPAVYRESGEPFGMRDRIWDRYIYEDTPFGTVMFSSLGKLLGVPTPVSDAINTLLGMLERVDFGTVGRTSATLGLEGMTAEEIGRFLEDGQSGPTLSGQPDRARGRRMALPPE